MVKSHEGHKTFRIPNTPSIRRAVTSFCRFPAAAHLDRDDGNQFKSHFC